MLYLYSSSPSFYFYEKTIHKIPSAFHTYMKSDLGFLWIVILRAVLLFFIFLFFRFVLQQEIVHLIRRSTVNRFQCIRIDVQRGADLRMAQPCRY